VQPYSPIVNDSVYIVCESDSGRQIVGSGTNVEIDRKDFIITAKHVVEAECKYSYCFGDGTCYNFKEYYSSSSSELSGDIALILSSKRSHLKFRDEKFYLNMELITYSRPWALFPSLSEGRVSHMPAEEDYIILNSYAAPGSSGGGVFYKGDFIAVIVAIESHGSQIDTSRVLVVPFKNFKILK